MKTYMKNYIDAALTFIESEEMRDYLREALPKLHGVATDCAHIVAYAPAPIERKLPVLEQIAQEVDPEEIFDREPHAAYVARFAQGCRYALEERHNGPEGAVFHVESRLYSEDDDINYPRALFTSFDAALRYLEHEMEEYPEEYAAEGTNHTVTKYVPDGSGRLAECCSWYLNSMRELWYFDYETVPQGFQGWYLPFYHYLNLPVPFQPGDIVVADCMPYAPSRRVLFLAVGDNLDCCCLTVLFFRKNGCLGVGAFKHDCYFYDDEYKYVSGLYRAARWTGELPAEEEAFSVLAPLIRAKPEYGEEIRDVFWKLEHRVRAKLRKEGLNQTYELEYAPSWWQLKEELGL